MVATEKWEWQKDGHAVDGRAKQRRRWRIRSGMWNDMAYIDYRVRHLQWLDDERGRKVGNPIYRVDYSQCRHHQEHQPVTTPVSNPNSARLCLTVHPTTNEEQSERSH